MLTRLDQSVLIFVNKVAYSKCNVDLSKLKVLEIIYPNKFFNYLKYRGIKFAKRKVCVIFLSKEQMDFFNKCYFVTLKLKDRIL